MMNPQYPPPGQNNNVPSNPLGYPPSQDFNGINANTYNQIPPNGPQKPLDQNEMAQKMQNMNINGPQGFPTIPTSQLPPGQFPPGAYPPTSNYGPGQITSGQRPPGAMPGAGRPPVSNPQFSPSMGPKPPTPGPVPTSHPQGFGPGLNSQFPPGPPMQQRPPSTQPGQGPPSQFQGPSGPGQPQAPPPHSQAGMPPHSQPGLPPHSQPGLPPHSQPGLKQGMPPMGPQPGLPQSGPVLAQVPQSQAGQIPQRPGQPGMPQSRPAQAPGLPPQPGMPNQPGQFPGQPGLQGLQQQNPGQPGFPQGPQQNQPSLPPQPGMPPQPQLSQPGLHPQPGQMPQAGQMPPQPGQMPGQPGGFLQQTQPGFPPQPGMMQQPGQLPPQPGQIPQPGQMSQPGQMPPQPGQMPPQPGQMPHQPGIMPQPQMAPQPGQPGQMQPGYQQMPGMPHMPPPLGQRQQYPASGAPPGPPGPTGPPGAPAPGSYPGMPPMPQAGQPPSGYPQQYQQQFPGQQPYPGQMYQQPQKRLDPDQMPSPIQVMADDQSNRGGVFVTNEKGLVPPLVTTDFVVDDKGNASPRYIRSSMYTVPVTADLLKQTAMPFCLVISPMAETVGAEAPPPLLDFAALTGSPGMGPVRCSRCKAYICPNMKFVDAGRHFHCAFCKATTEVPMEYTQYINSMQQYGRVPAEMALGAYEIVATKEYCRNNTLPNPPAIVFVIDVSYNSIKSGLLDTICENVMEIIAAMPKDEQTGKSWTRVGFITYSSTVHFYNIKGSLAQPQMLSVGDVADMFVPLLEGFLCTPEDGGTVLAALLEQLPHAARDNKETETILLPAVQAGLEALKAADTSGQLLVFHTSLPTYNAPGKLTNREDRKLLGTDKEKTILNPASTAYNEVGQACSAAGVSVELFVCNQGYVDTATVGQLARLTGGQLRKYTYFTAEVDGPRLVWDAVRTVSRPTAHDAVMRVRTSTGVRATDFYGHMFMSNTTDVELAAVDSDKAIGIEIKHDDKLTSEDGVYIQAALLYTHRSGQRRLRILNLALNVAHQLADVYRSMELDTCINFLTKQAVWLLREHPPRQVRAGLSSRCARSLAAYRRHCASPSSAGQLVLPESMKLLPLYTSCMLRSDAIAGGPDISCDDRSCAMYRALTADVATSVVSAYPRLLALHRLPDRACCPLRASLDKMHDSGVYMLENGVHMLIWVGSQASAEFVRDVFGVPSPQQIDTQVTELPVLENPSSEAVRQLVHDARVLRRSAMRLTVMRQHDKLEAVLRHFLVEDRGVDGSSSYVDYLCHVHKEIRALL